MKEKEEKGVIIPHFISSIVVLHDYLLVYTSRERDKEAFHRHIERRREVPLVLFSPPRPSRSNPLLSVNSDL